MNNQGDEEEPEKETVLEKQSDKVCGSGNHSWRNTAGEVF